MSLKELAVAVGGEFVEARAKPRVITEEMKKKGFAKIAEFHAFCKKHVDELYPKGDKMVAMDRKTGKFKLVPSDRL